MSSEYERARQQALQASEQRKREKEAKEAHAIWHAKELANAHLPIWQDLFVQMTQVGCCNVLTLRIRAPRRLVRVLFWEKWETLPERWVDHIHPEGVFDLRELNRMLPSSTMRGINFSHYSTEIKKLIQKPFSVSLGERNDSIPDNYMPSYFECQLYIF